MKSPAPRAPTRREKIVDSMARKFADSGSVEQIIVRHRKSRIRPAFFIYILIGLSVISTGITTLVMTGKIDPGLPGREIGGEIPKKNSLDLLREDLESRRISPDQYALYITDYLIHFGSFPDRYKTGRISVTSGEMFRALHAVWPKVSLHTRSSIFSMIPHLESRWSKDGLGPAGG